MDWQLNGTVLAAWMRLKYPHVAIGALASSAPVLQFEDIVPPETFYDLVSNDFRVRNFSLSFFLCPRLVILSTYFMCSVKVPAASTQLKPPGLH